MPTADKYDTFADELETIALYHYQLFGEDGTYLNSTHTM